jgi:putative N6-adenine-specific DNA methylase
LKSSQQLLPSIMMADTNQDEQRLRMIAKTIYGSEDLLAKELTDLGASDVKTMNRSVEFHGDKRLLYEANLRCRTATRILKPIGNFKAADENELYRATMRIDWGKYIGLQQTFAIDAVIVESNFTNSLYVAQKTKDAIADQFRSKTGQRPSVNVKIPDILINVYIYQNQCTLAIDSSGEPLFKRGYRRKTGEAPLNEVLAAGIVLRSEWDRNSSFVDAMCGSGTIVIEAALLARNIAPGLTRKKFGFMNWANYDSDLFRLICEKARKAIIPKLNFQIVGSDIDLQLIREATENANQAGVGSDIIFKQSDIADLVPPPPPGVVIINPPYGDRLSVDDIQSSYHAIGDAFKKHFTNYDAFVFTGNAAAAKSIGLRTSRRIPMYNGPIECRLLKFEMYRGSRKSV